MSADPIAETMREGVNAEVFPGAVLLVWHRGETVHHAAYGYASLPDREPATCDTIYDLASLTKPLATATAMAMLVSEGRVSLGAPLEQSIPELSQDGLRHASLRHLLNHSAGLPAWRPFYAQICPDGRRLRASPLIERRRAMYDAIHREPLVEAVGARSLYSDLGFILIGEALERTVRRDWAEMCQQ